MVTQTQNTLAIGHNDDFDIILLDVIQNLKNLALVFDGNEKPSGLQEIVAEFLARFTNRRRIDNRHHLFDVIAHHFEEKRFIGIVQSIEVEITLDGQGEGAHEGHRTASLFFKRFHSGGQEAPNTHLVSFFFGESRTAILKRITQDILSAARASHFQVSQKKKRGLLLRKIQSLILDFSCQPSFSICAKRLLAVLAESDFG